MANKWRNNGNSDRLYFEGAPKSLQMVTAAMKLKDTLLGRKAMTYLDNILKSWDIYSTNNGLNSQSHGFSSSHIWMWELDHKEGWVLKNWCFKSVVLEKTLESPLDCKEIQPVHLEGNQSWIFIGGLDVEAETPIFWPPAVKNWLSGKDPDAGKNWRQEEKRMSEDEMIGWHHLLNGHEFEQTLRVGDGPGGLTWCSPWDCKESDMTEWLNWAEVTTGASSLEKLWDCPCYLYQITHALTAIPISHSVPKVCSILYVHQKQLYCWYNFYL